MGALSWLEAAPVDNSDASASAAAAADAASSSDMPAPPPPPPPPGLDEVRPPPPPIPEGARTAEVEADPPAEGAEEVRAETAKQSLYDKYLDKETVARGLADGSLLQGTLVVSGKSLSTAFVRPPGARNNDNDIVILGKTARNRAMHGDIVAVKLVAEDEARNWSGSGGAAAAGPADQAKDDDVEVADVDEKRAQAPTLGDSDDDESEDEVVNLSAMAGNNKTEKVTPQAEKRFAKVVAIVDPKGSKRLVVCTLHPNPTRKDDDRSDGMVRPNDKWLRAVPTDKRMSWMKLKLNDSTAKVLDLEVLPKKLNPFQFWTVKMSVWQESAVLPLCQLTGECLGQAGDLVAEERHALIEHDLADHENEFSDALLDEVDEIVRVAQRDFEEEVTTRRQDLRKKRIFTIDPATAKDLDDAIHIDDDPERGEVEIGVHIADVGHFVKLGSLADKEAQFRTTSVYLINRVLPMLPHGLCNHLCSLNPAEPKLSFSAFFRLKKDTGELVEEGPYKPWFMKTAICSVCRLNYDEVQEMLDGKDIEPPAVHGGYTWQQIKDDIFLMYDVCGKVRKARFDGGALSISKKKMIFHTRESEDGLPKGYHLEQHSASHWIIEELMLLANRCVAKHLAHSTVSDWAVLRNHEAPDREKANELAKLMTEHLGLEWESYNAGSIYRSCQALYRKYGEVLGLCVEMMVMRNGMQQAQYFVHHEGADCHHFALDFDYYTHFTSPIRRYPDVMVHRVLAALIGFAEPDSYQDVGDAQIQVNQCNDKKQATKRCSEQIDRAVFCIYLRGMKSWFYTIGTVLKFKENKSRDGESKGAEVTVYSAQLGKESIVQLKIGDGKPENLEEMGLFCSGVEDELILPDNWRFCSRGMVELSWLPPDGDRTRKKKQTLQTLSCIPIVIIPTNTVPIDYAVFFVSPFRKQELFEQVPESAAKGFAWNDVPDEDGADGGAAAAAA